jgi:hypothetical protein
MNLARAHTSPTKFLRRGCIWWLLATVYVLVFGEIFIRILVPTAVIPRYVTGAPYGVRVGMPNLRFPQTSPETRVEIRTNSRGLRSDREFSYDKPPGVCRVLLLGDSLFVGYEVDIEDSFAYLLERRLAAAGYACQVINLAVSGFGTAEMLITLQEEGLKYHPDIVVFSSHETDLDDNVRSGLFRLDNRGGLVRAGASFLPGIALSDALSRFALYRWVVETSQLYAALRERAAFHVKTLLVSMQSADHEEAKPQKNPFAAPPPSDPYAQRLNLKLLEEAKRVTQSSGARFCVLEIPVNKSRTEFARMLPDYNSDVVSDLKIFIPLAAFQNAADPNRKIFYEKAHGHLSPFGNQLLTDFFFARLQETGWLRR